MIDLATIDQLGLSEIDIWNPTVVFIRIRSKYRIQNQKLIYPEQWGYNMKQRAEIETKQNGGWSKCPTCNPQSKCSSITCWQEVHEGLAVTYHSTPQVNKSAIHHQKEKKRPEKRISTVLMQLWILMYSIPLKPRQTLGNRATNVKESLNQMTKLLPGKSWHRLLIFTRKNLWLQKK